ncbi:MAG TPA: hypothetical protein VG649_18750 [Candidatus Angelobacter sp.]|jgi:hypothetical protein|nr:hypothetical protein [Candidatus Angelobacter sp.]
MTPRIFLTGLVGLVVLFWDGLILYPILKGLMIALLIGLAIVVVAAVVWIWVSWLDWLDLLFFWLDWF